MSGLIIIQIGAGNSVTGGLSNASENTLSVLDLTMQGGWIMAILGILALIALYIFVERYVAIRKASQDNTQLMDEIREFMHNGKMDSAISLCRNTNSPISRMLEKGLIRIGRPLNDINSAIENVGKLEIARMEKNVAALATIAGAAPMLGFMGTVIGMIVAFYNLSRSGTSIDITLLSNGLYQALVTTVGGLIVGIFALVFYNILVSKVEKLIFIMEARALEFMDLLHEQAL
jgi:biopolymer transport protein ExbB